MGGNRANRNDRKVIVLWDWARKANRCDRDAAHGDRCCILNLWAGGKHREHSLEIFLAEASAYRLPKLQFAVQATLIVLVRDFVLMLEQPIDTRFVAHRFVNRLSHGFAMDFE